MKNNTIRNNILRYSISAGICLILVFVIAWVSGLFSSWEVVKEKTNWSFVDDFTKNMFILTNSSFAVGVICASIGLLVFASNGGAFEFIVYGFKRFFSLFQRDPTKVKFRTYADYHDYRSEQPNAPFLYLIIVGAAFIGISMIFLAFYQNGMPAK